MYAYPGVEVGGYPVKAGARLTLVETSLRAVARLRSVAIAFLDGICGCCLPPWRLGILLIFDLHSRSGLHIGALWTIHSKHLKLDDAHLPLT